MTSNSTTPCLAQSEIETAEHLFDNWFDPIEAGLRDRARQFLQAMLEAELDESLARSRYALRAKRSSGGSEGTVSVTGHRHGHRSRTLLGTFGQVEIAVPRARLNTPNGNTTEWKSRTLRAYQRRTLAADALIAGCYLAGTNTRRVRRALRAVFGGAVCKDTVSRVWRKVKSERVRAGLARAKAEGKQPVSDANTLANRELNREFLRIPALLRDFRAQSASEFNGLQLNSLRNGTGNFCAETGNVLERTGNLVETSENRRF
jgi:hypothetical protein